MSGTRDGIFRIATDRNGAQQRSRLPSRRPRSPLTIAQRTGKGRAADTSDATQAVKTQSSTPSNETDPVIIILSALGAVALVALIATVTVAKKKKVAEQKARDVEVPSMISAQSCDAQNSPTDARHVFVAHSNGRS
ncbi:unnamed protein product [Hyaloperonospora brassicae]|nr:unnamed protein product [Hyaloperonospora brassicae]